MAMAITNARQASRSSSVCRRSRVLRPRCENSVTSTASRSRGYTNAIPFPAWLGSRLRARPE